MRIRENYLRKWSRIEYSIEGAYCKSPIDLPIQPRPRNWYHSMISYREGIFVRRKSTQRVRYYVEKES
jgi:hypothetical protein